jgi:transcriptional regulator with GAF, ATPase, and Fis domain
MANDDTRVVERELESFERLTADISTRFSILPVDELLGAIEATLQRIVETLDVDRSTVLELSEDGDAVESLHFWARPDIPPLRLPDALALSWYLGVLRRGEIVRVSDAERDLPPVAAAEWAYTRQTGMKSNLTVPVSLGGRLVSALAVGTFRHPREWPDPLVERVRLIAEIIGAALQRRRHELALRESVAEIERLNRRLQTENRYLHEEIRSSQEFNEIVGKSEALRLALGRVEQVAPTDSTVMLLGESGTGKELFARAIHDLSPRRQRALVRVNCAALPAGLIESELFGHEKGAFTGAVAQRPGRFEVADGGTLFLDEVVDLPVDLQGRLLRVLQEGEFERVGSSRTMRVDARVIAATNRDLEAAVRDGSFRLDLYYRLTVFPIALPPLRNRREDIPELVWFFITRHQRRMGRHIKRVPRAAMEALQRYDWPGNLRELQNVVERSMIRSTGDVLEVDEVLGGGRRRATAPSADRALAAVERAHIEAVLDECGWRINGGGHAAEMLGLHPNTLRFRMKKLGITRPSRRATCIPAPPVASD